MGQMSSQRVRYLNTSDGLRLAWAEAGAGPPLVKASNWLTHLEYDVESPVWRHWIRFFSEHFRFVRYDERGCGMTDWNVENLSMPRRVGDLEAVIDAAGVTEPFTLLGMSQGASLCIEYAVRHPDRVSRLILYGAYAQGWARRGDPTMEREYASIIELMRAGWGRDNPVFRQVFTSRFIPGATAEQLAWFNALCLKSANAHTAAELLRSRSAIDVVSLLPMVKVPTLVLHAREDGVCPISQGHLIASGIRDAQFVELDSQNHILLEHEPAWARFCETVMAFAGSGSSATGEDAAFGALSPREREVLALLAGGLGNADIAARLGISDKTVRNHLSNIFDKLGVWTRAQAIVFARERGFTRPD